MLVALCVITPEIEERLKQVLPGRGRQQAAEAVEGATRVFSLADSLADGDKRELAWLSFALLKNVNCCGVSLLRGEGANGVLVVRGAVSSGAAGSGGGAAVLKAVGQVSGCDVLTSTCCCWGMGLSWF